MERSGPSKGWYAVAGAVVAVATVAAVAIFVLGIVDTVTGYHSIPRGQPVVIDLERGDYTLYWEQRTDRPHGVPTGYEILDPRGLPVPTSPYGSEELLSRGQFDAVAIATFTAPIDGAYTFVSPLADLGVSEGLFEQIGKSFVLAFAVGTAGFLVGLGIFLFVFLRRRSSRQAMEPAYAGPAAGLGGASSFEPEWTGRQHPAGPTPATPATPPPGSPPPGWYPDPEADGLRYWDGTRWTDHRAVRG